MKRFTGHTEPWGSFLDAKVNAPVLLKRQLERRRTPIKGMVYLSSVTDPYTPSEKRYRLTRGVLEVLLEHQVQVSILTKSDLVLRDMEIFREFKNCTVGLSIMTLNEDIALHFEPGAPSPKRRLKALDALNQNGIDTYAFISPYLPYISDIEPLIAALKGSVRELAVEMLNMRGANWTGVKNVLSRYAPELLPDYKDMVNDRSYWDRLESRARKLTAQADISFMFFARH